MVHFNRCIRTSQYGPNLFKVFSEKPTRSNQLLFASHLPLRKHLGIRKPSCNFSLSIQHSAVVYGMWVWSTVLFLLGGHSPLWRNIKQAKYEGNHGKSAWFDVYAGVGSERWGTVQMPILTYLNQRYQTIYTILQLVNLGQKYNKYIVVKQCERIGSCSSCIFVIPCISRISTIGPGCSGFTACIAKWISNAETSTWIQDAKKTHPQHTAATLPLVK